MAQTAEPNVNYSAGDAEVAIRSPAKNRYKGTQLAGETDSTKRLLMFERASKNWWSPQFDSAILESQHEKNYFQLYRRRFRSALVYVIIVSLAWAVFFAVMSRDYWMAYLSGAVVVAILTAVVLGFTFVTVYKAYYLVVWLAYSVVLCVAVLLAYVFLGSSLSPVGAFTASLELLLLLYTLIPLPLYLCFLIAIIYSLSFELLSAFLTTMTTPGIIVGRALLHVCIHILGLHLFTQWQARKRSTFLRVGQSILMRSQMKQDQEAKQHMIHSLMPKKVAEEVMETRNKDKDEPGAARQPEAVVQKGKMTFRTFHMSQMENVSILFADIVGFTRMSSGKQAAHLVALLNDLFGRFDILCQQSGCEKISTLGDCYYCVSGCPEPREDHAVCCIEMGMGMCKAIQQFDRDHNEDVNMRVGVHTGTVLCGIVGTRRFKFDVWSNDVTLANMMESEGEPGKVHISESTLAFIKDHYEIESGKEVPDIRKHKVLIEDYNAETQQYQVRHVQEKTTIKTYFIVGRKDGMSSPLQPQSPKLSPSTETANPDEGGEKTSPDKEQGPVTDVQIVVDVPTDDEHQSPTGSGGAGAEAGDTVDSDTDKGDKAINGQADAANGMSPALMPGGEPGTLATSSEDLDTSKDEDVRETALLNQLQSRGSNAETDQKMVEEMSAEHNMEEYLHRPPIHHFTLNFRRGSDEFNYRQNYLDCNLAAPATLSMPRLSGLLDVMVSGVFVILLSLAIFLGLPLQPVWAAVFVLVLLLEALIFAIILADLCHQGQQAGIKRLLAAAGSWYPRQLFGGILIAVPAIAVFINFSCHTFEVFPVSDLFFCCLLLASLVHFCNFTMLSSWMKSSLAAVAGLVLLALVLAGVCRPDAAPAASNATIDYSVDTSTDVSVKVNGSLEDIVMFNGNHPLRWEVILNVIFLLLLIFFLNREFEISYRLSFYGDHQAKQDQQKTQEEKEQADWLLHNIIPEHVTTVLKKTSKYSQTHKDVGVVFAKVVNFDDFYDESFEGGREYYRVLNELISDMEDLFDDPRFKDVEKIKTIGSCLMVASGLNTQRRAENRDPNAHLYALMDFSIELMNKLDQFNAEIFNFDFEMAIGYNFGEVTAGVIGTTKLLYDIWGDTVNISSRMYSTGVQGRIQVPEETLKKLEDKFEFEYRAKTYVKGKGEMATYLLVKKKDGATWD